MMRDDEQTMYINGTPEEDKESTVYIGKGQSERVDENTVYVGKGTTESKDTEPVKEDVSSASEPVVSSKEDPIVHRDKVEVDQSVATDRSVHSSEMEGEVQYYLPTNTMLQKRYRINSVLGEGGFGITYSGWDVTLNIPVAIKEYYPSGLVTRNATFGKTTQVVPVASAKYGTQFRDGIDRVLDEARRMAKFRNTPGIVGIYDFFEANNTAYIVMEYIEGTTLDVYCKENRMDNTTLFNMLVPVMDALQALHNEGIIHRDISPDNIMVDNDGNFKLLDFGAARGYSEESSTTMSVILKKSYAPEEQFRTKGNQGPWTDVYALGATIYELITGQTPPTSIDRLAEDDIVDIKEAAPALTKGQAEAIMTALAVRQKDRWQSVNEFKIALLNQNGKSIKELNKSQTKAIANGEKEHKSDNESDSSKGNALNGIITFFQNNKKKCILSILAIVAIIAIVALFGGKRNVGPGYLGVYSSDVPDDVKNEYEVGDGTYITGVIAGTPAAKYGFVAGDIMVALDGNELKGTDDFSSLITRYYSGDKVKIKYLHISKDGKYEEKTQTVKLANKNDQDEINFTVSSVTTNTGSTDAASKYDDLVFEFVGFEPHGASSGYADIYFKVTNPNSETLSIRPSGVYLNDVSVTNYSFDGITGNADSVVSKQVDYSSTNKKLIGDNITSFRIEYYITGDNGSSRTFSQDGFVYSIENGEFVNDDQKADDSAIEEVVEEDTTETNIINEEEDIVAPDLESLPPSNEDIVITLVEIKEGSSYTDIVFRTENNSNETVTLSKDWVYVNDTSIKRATSDGLLELAPHTGSIVEYSFHSDVFQAAKGNQLEKVELSFKINDSDEATLFEVYSNNDNGEASIDRVLANELARMKEAEKSKNLEVTVSEVKEGSSYTDVTFTVKNISSDSIELGKSWSYFNGFAVYRATSDGSHTLAPGKSTVIEYSYHSNYVKGTEKDKLSLVRLQFYINDSEKPELFYYKVQ